MFLLSAGCAVFVLFLPFIILAGLPTKGSGRSAVRLMSVGGGTARPISSVATDPLLKGNPEASRLKFTKRPLALLARMGIDDLIVRSDSHFTPLQITALSFGVQVVATSCVGLAGHSWWLALLVGTGIGYAPVQMLRVRANRRVKQMEVALPQVADMLSRALRAGQSLPTAISIVAEQGPNSVRKEFAEIFHQQKFGIPLHEAFLQLLKRVPSQELKMLATGILVQRDTGGNLTLILDRMSSLIRERMKIDGDIRVETAQGRLTGCILCLLPILLLLLMRLLSPTYWQVLVNDSLGRTCLWISFGLLGCGALIIRYMVKSIEI